MLSPNREREHFDQHLSDRLVTLVRQPVEQTLQTSCGGFAAQTRRFVFYPAIIVKEFQGQPVIAWNIRGKKSVACLDASGMQIRRDPLPCRTRRASLLPQQPCGSDFSLARVWFERGGQHGRAVGDKREQSGKANCCYQEKMDPEPDHADAL